MKKEMLINVLQPEEIRIAIIEDGVLEELYVERTSHESYVGNIYKGRIVNIEPSIQAAFVDFGVGRNGFLHVSDVEPAYYRHLESAPYGRRDRDGDRDDRRGGRGGRGGRPPQGRGRDEPARRPPPVIDDDFEDALLETPLEELEPLPALPEQPAALPPLAESPPEPPPIGGFGAGIFDDPQPTRPGRAAMSRAAPPPAAPTEEPAAADEALPEEKEPRGKGRRRSPRGKRRARGAAISPRRTPRPTSRCRATRSRV